MLSAKILSDGEVLVINKDKLEKNSFKTVR